MKNLKQSLPLLLILSSSMWSQVLWGLVTMPEGCLGQKSACAVKTGDDTFRSKSLINSELFLFHNTSVFVDSTGYLFLLSGTLRSQSYKLTQIRSIFADFSFQGDVYFRSEKDKVLARNVAGTMKITLRDGTDLILPEGFEIWIAGLDMNKKSSLGMYRKLDLKDHIRLWSLSFEGGKKAFLKDLAEYKETYTQIRKNEVELFRGVASDLQQKNEAKEQAHERREFLQKRDKEVRRKLFFERTFSR